jgi:hypothetical protein
LPSGGAPGPIEGCGRGARVRSDWGSDPHRRGVPCPGSAHDLGHDHSKILVELPQGSKICWCVGRAHFELDQTRLESISLGGQLIVAGHRVPATFSLGALVFLNPSHIFGADDHCLNIGRCAMDLDRQCGRAVSATIGVGSACVSARLLPWAERRPTELLTAPCGLSDSDAGIDR